MEPTPAPYVSPLAARKPAGQVLYFAYGANIGRKRFSSRFPGADWLGVARLPEHRLFIASHGYAGFEPASREAVWGSLWLFPAAELDALDEFEEVGRGFYERVTVKVVTPAGPVVEAMVYQTRMTEPGRPAMGYISEVVRGAKESGLPASYVDRIADLGA
jgi:gamma-glutamylcyclotransferase